MKELFFAILMAFTLVLLCSCGNNVEAPTKAPTEAPTEAPNEAPTEPATEAPYDTPTEAPAETPTETPYDVPTETPTETLTESPTETPIDEYQTEGPYDPSNKTPTETPAETTTETPTEIPPETPTEAPTDTPTDSLLDDSDVRSDLIPFTVELTQNLYDTNDEKICFHIRGKEPGFFGRGDQWILYKIENGEKILVGERMVEIALECIPPSESEYYEQDGFLFISSLCGSDTKTLEVGTYCLEFPMQYPDENGIYQTCAAARMYFKVVEATE